VAGKAQVGVVILEALRIRGPCYRNRSAKETTSLVVVGGGAFGSVAGKVKTIEALSDEEKKTVFSIVDAFVGKKM
jgi:hypothetical protein